MARLNTIRVFAIVFSVLLVVGGAAIGSSDIAASDTKSVVGQPIAESVAEQDSDSPAVTFENQTTDGTIVVVRSVTIPDGGFIVIHNESGAVVGQSEYLSPVRYKNVTVPVTIRTSASRPQLAQMQSLLNRTQSRERTMFAMMNQTMRPGMMRNQTVRHGQMHDVVTEPDRHRLMHQMNQSMSPQMVGLMLNQTRDFRQMHALMQMLMRNGTVNQTSMQAMIQLMNWTEERETLMFQQMMNRSLGRQQMRTLMLNQTRDFAQMHLLMAQLRSQQLTAQGLTLTAMLHRDTNGNEEFDFPEADGPYTVDDEPVTDSARIVVQQVVKNETTTGA